MNAIRPLLCLAALFSGLLAKADTPLPPGVVVPRPQMAASFNQPTPRPELSKNYKVTLVITADKKSVGELKILTCSPSIQAEATIDLTETPTSVGFTGTLTEKEGQLLLLDYNLRFTLPITTSATSPQLPNQPQPANMVRNIQYQQQSVSGSLKMKPGNEYEFLKTAGRNYSLRITPQED